MLLRYFLMRMIDAIAIFVGINMCRILQYNDNDLADDQPGRHIYQQQKLLHHSSAEASHCPKASPVPRCTLAFTRDQASAHSL